MKSGAEQRHFEKNYVSHNLSLNSQLKADQLKYAFKITLIKNWKKTANAYVSQFQKLTGP